MKTDGSIPDSCTECGGNMKYSGRGTYTCEKCRNVAYDDFGLVSAYLDEKGPASAPVISRAVGLPIARVRELLDQGRLEAIPGSEGMIDAGPVDTGEKKPKFQGISMEKANREDGRIRFQGRSRK